MHPILNGLVFGVALLCAAAMGLAIQRGATCTVAAVDELLTHRRPTRLLAIIEASLWATAGVLLARELGHPMATPAGYALTGWTLLGASLLGLGAFVNQACVMGAVARLGSGQWAYLATPVGFYLGCASADALFAMPAPQALSTPSPVLQWPGWIAWLLCAALAWRAGRAWRRHRPDATAPWPAHAATCVIGAAFVLLFVLAGPWAYTDVLAQVARRMTQDLPSRTALGLALFAGALVGGRWSGSWRRHPWRVSQVLRCALGGLLMGWGGLLIPGGNDGILLLGMPLLWPFAWAAFAVMVIVVAGAMIGSRRLAARR